MTVPDRIRVVIADDHDVVRAGLAAIVDSEADLRVVGHASNGDEAARVAAEASADVVLMDVSMPGTDGIEGVSAVRKARPEAVVVMLTTFNVDDSIEQALRSGAAGYLLKTASAADLVAAIRSAHAGTRVFSQAVQERLIDSFLGRAEPPPPPPDELNLLTERELEVFGQLARGRSNAEIAKALYLSEATVKTYVTRLLAKLGLRDRVQAVIFALQHGLVIEEDTEVTQAGQQRKRP